MKKRIINKLNKIKSNKIKEVRGNNLYYNN
jgi:hypothetical protein